MRTNFSPYSFLNKVWFVSISSRLDSLEGVQAPQRQAEGEEAVASMVGVVPYALKRL